MKVLKLVILLFVVTGLVSFSDTFTPIKEEKEGSTCYYLFDGLQYVNDLMSTYGLKLENKSSALFIVDYDNGVANWNVRTQHVETYEREVVQNIMSDGKKNMTNQRVYVSLEFINNKLLDQVFVDDEEDFESIALSFWLANEESRQSQFDLITKQTNEDTLSMMTGALLNDDISHFISGPTKLEASQVNIRHYAVHKELYGSFIIDIFIDGGWSSHDEVSKVLNELVVATKADADLAMLRVGYYEDLLSEDVEAEEVEEVEADQYKVKGTLRFLDDSKIADDVNDENLIELALLYNYSISNQAIYLSVYDEESTEIATIGPAFTDKKGRFEFDYPYDFEEDYSIVCVTPLVAFKSANIDSMTLAVMDRKYSGATNNYVYLKVEDKLIYDEEDLELGDLFLYDVYTNVFINGDQDNNDFALGFPYALAYHNLQMVEAFYTENIDYKLQEGNKKPLKVYLSSSDVLINGQAANYDHLANYINIADFLTSIYDSVHLDSVLFHEFSHKVMYDLYGGRYPKAALTDSFIGTYANETTAHSFTEGFAYFMQHVVKAYFGGSGRSFFSPIYGNLEPDYPAWLNGGLNEARAVAGVLYDLYDDGSKNNNLDTVVDDDGMTIPIKSLLDIILSQPLNSFAEFYEKLVLSFPNDKEAIDKIVIAHGFFSVEESTLDGLGDYHAGEAFVDANQNLVYDEGETVINYNAEDKDGLRYQVYKEGSKIGYASYALRENRPMQAYDQIFRIKSNGTFESYTMTAEFADAPYLDFTMPVSVSDGYINLSLIPYQYEATITLVPTGYESDVASYVITTAEIRSNYANIIEKGYLSEYNFDHDVNNHLMSDLESIMPIVMSQVLSHGNLDTIGDDLNPETLTGLHMDALQAYDFLDDYPERILVIEKEEVEEVLEETDATVAIIEETVETPEEDKNIWSVVIIVFATLSVVVLMFIRKKKKH